MSNEFQFTEQERLTLANQFLILGRLAALTEGPQPVFVNDVFASDAHPLSTTSGSSRYYEKKAKILLEGHEAYYSEIYNDLYKNTIPKGIDYETKELVYMFEDLERIFKTFSEEEKESIDLKKFAFEGFDNKDPHYTAIKFLAEYDSNEVFAKYNYPGHDYSLLSRYRRLYSIYYAQREQGQLGASSFQYMATKV